MTLNLSRYDVECLAKAKQLIEADLRRHYSIAELATHVAMGKTKFKEAFLQHYGASVYTYLQQQRMKLALELLSDTEKTMKQIARLTGYRHHSNFSTAFRNFYNMSPGKARKNNQVT